LKDEEIRAKKEEEERLARIKREVIEKEKR